MFRSRDTLLRKGSGPNYSFTIDKLHNTLNKLMINRNKTIEAIETTIETLKTIEDCANYKDKEVGRNSFDEFRKLINEVDYNLENNLFGTNFSLNEVDYNLDNNLFGTNFSL